MKEKISIHFYGAAGTVTGSKYLIQTGSKNILIDCGMFQGLKKLRLLNWNDLPFDPKKIDIVLLTHGHLDHVGYLPKLIKTGFSGPIWGTGPTLKIAKIILEDSAKIQEEDSDRANKKSYTKHKPAKPLYNLNDVKKTLSHFEEQVINKWINLDENISCRFRSNSHIIGATFIELKIGAKLFVFSGDIGRDNDLLMHPAHKPDSADVLVIESTYGNRNHPENPENKLLEIINLAVNQKGTIIIPGFAVERIQMLMYLLWKFQKDGKISKVPIYMDSPMGRNVLDVFVHNAPWHKLTPTEIDSMSKDIILVETMQDTFNLAEDPSPKIIIAGSGMASGGRVLSYFEKYLGDPLATILLVGYQAEGTRGRQLLEGVQEIKMYGKYYSVKAKIENIEGLSAHTDQKGLIEWMKLLKKKPERIFIVHGEPIALQALADKIKEVYGWDCEIPVLNQKADI